MFEEEKKPSKIWPRIENAEDAKSAAKQGYHAALFISALTALVATISLAMHKSVIGVNALAYVDAAFYGFAAWRIKRFSRVFAVLATSVYFLDKLQNFLALNISSWPVIGILLLMFANGLRGVFAYHRFKSDVFKVTSLGDCAPAAVSTAADSVAEQESIT